MVGGGRRLAGRARRGVGWQHVGSASGGWGWVGVQGGRTLVPAAAKEDAHPKADRGGGLSPLDRRPPLVSGPMTSSIIFCSVGWWVGGWGKAAGRAGEAWRGGTWAALFASACVFTNAVAEMGLKGRGPGARRPVPAASRVCVAAVRSVCVCVCVCAAVRTAGACRWGGVVRRERPNRQHVHAQYAQHVLCPTHRWRRAWCAT